MAEIWASPKGERVGVNGKAKQTVTYAEAVARAQPGDVVRLAKGDYKPDKNAKLTTSGSRDKPITIRGEDGARFVGNRIDLADPNSVLDDSNKSDPALTLAADWIIVENLSFAHCWPHAVVLKGCRDIVIRDCTGTQSRRFIWAMNSEEGANPRVLTERILVERVRWTQDPDQLLWSGEIEWCHVKQDAETGECCKIHLHPNRSFFNGAMFASRDIYGNVTIRNCRISHAFNGIRMDAEARADSRRPSNVNIQIYDNDFEFIRDNATEPEGYAVNVWIHNNRFRNTYATFSFDDIWGGYWYVFANTVWTDQPLSGADDGHDWGQCFKFHNEAMPRWPIYSFHNSVHTPFPYAKEGFTRRWSDYNNAVEFIKGGNPFDKSEPSFPPYFKTPRQYFGWDPSYQFHQTLTNHPGFPSNLNRVGLMVSGLHSDCVFTEAKKANLSLTKGSPGRGASADMPIAFANGKACVIRGGNDIGARQGKDVLAGPSFVAFADHHEAGEFTPP